jgi:DNA-binding HxlR family transcriptional regulator
MLSQTLSRLERYGTYVRTYVRNGARIPQVPHGHYVTTPLGTETKLVVCFNTKP